MQIRMCLEFGVRPIDAEKTKRVLTDMTMRLHQSLKEALWEAGEDVSLGPVTVESTETIFTVDFCDGMFHPPPEKRSRGNAPK